MQALRFNEQFVGLLGTTLQLVRSLEADAVILLLEDVIDWQRLKGMSQSIFGQSGRPVESGQPNTPGASSRKPVGEIKVVVAADAAAKLVGAKESGLSTVLISSAEAPVYERITRALLEAVADDILLPGSTIVALYSGFEAGAMDSISVIELDEHLNRLSGRDLRQLETRVPLDTLKTVVDLAVEIGREGREGKPVGTIFVVGDTRKVMACSRPVGFDPVRGYGRKERNLNDPRVREGIKEIAQMDGAIIVSGDGTVEAACRYLDSSAANITLSKGLGARHWAAAAISKATNAVTITVSQSNGTVRIFQDGEVVLRIEPFERRPMVWREFDYESPAGADG